MVEIEETEKKLSQKLKCVVSGSFKFKPEIDLKIEELKGNGFEVLAPETGWIYKSPNIKIASPDSEFRPLPSEVGMSPKQIEDDFLKSLKEADFLFVVCPGGYIGNSVALEIGFAIANNIPVILSEPIDYSLDPDLWGSVLTNHPQLLANDIK